MSEPFLTAALPGTGGVIRESPDDFRVEEIPLYLPSGDGEHLYVTVEKRGLTTHQLLRRAARHFDVPERDIGYAGLKDADAVTVQTISIPLAAPEDAGRLEDERVRVLSAARHRNKLRLGHLAGNRFRIRIADPHPGALSRARDVLAELGRTGVPNYFGHQRYGALGNSHRIGRAIVRDDFDTACHELMGDPESIVHPDWSAAVRSYRDGRFEAALERLPAHCRYERMLLGGLCRGHSARKALFGLPRTILRLYLSAYQSSLFDRIVTMRMATIDRIWPGDIAFKHVNGACFRVTDANVEQERADRFEISATGPLFGRKVMLAAGQSGILEESLLDKEGLTLSSFKLGKGLDLDGERRPLRVPLDDASADLQGESLVLAFTLPKGSYATSLLREVMKAEPAAA